MHCRDRFERTRLKMEARKVLEARLWARKTRAGKQCTPLKRGGELKKGEEKEASSREGIRISIYRKLRGLWEESSPDITGRNAGRNANRGRCWIRILGEEEKKRERMNVGRMKRRRLSGGIKICNLVHFLLRRRGNLHRAPSTRNL